MTGLVEPYDGPDMRVSRRDFVRAAASAAAAGSIPVASMHRLAEALGTTQAPQVIWIQGSGCDGCAVSFLNSVSMTTVDDVLLNHIDLEFQNNLMAATGDLAVSAAQAAAETPGYILVIEGATPIAADGKYCMVWQGTSMLDAVTSLSVDAGHIIALGSCAAFGGVSAGAPDITQAKGVGDVIGADPRLINLPGCPAHPDWLVGTIIELLAGNPVPLDADRRPLQFFGTRIHDRCENRAEFCGSTSFAMRLGDEGCLEFQGCRGKRAFADCPIRRWNSGGPGEPGVNWCVGSRNPCLGCVERGFPDQMSPLYTYMPPLADETTGNREAGHGDDDHD